MRNKKNYRIDMIK